MKLNAKKAGAVVSVLLLLLFMVACALMLSSCEGKFEEGVPVVFDNGSEYSVVWATKKDTAGYVTYTYSGEDYRVSDQNEGKLAVGRTHSVRIPYEHLENNSYKVNYFQVKKEKVYNPKTGSVKTSGAYAFKGDYYEKTDADIFIASDWHTKTDLLLKVAEKQGKYDLAIMMGDAADLGSESDFIQYIISVGHKITKGVIPAVFVRGNHETRGAGGHNLASRLGLRSLYYQINRGKYLITVLDMGEDKPDSHAEYGGLADYRAYHEQQTKWVESDAFLSGKEGQYKIILCHNKNFCGLEDYWGMQKNNEMAEIWAGKVFDMQPHIMFSGHSHELHMTLPGAPVSRVKYDDNFFPRNYHVIEDGGITDKGKDYIAVKLTIRGKRFSVIAKHAGGDTPVFNNYFKQEDTAFDI
jgi:predicted phosphodiesterase